MKLAVKDLGWKYGILILRLKEVGGLFECVESPIPTAGTEVHTKNLTEFNLAPAFIYPLKEI